jgi:DNA-binding response OmpR family regulator
MKDILLAEDDHDDVLTFDLALKEMSFPATLRIAEDGDKLFSKLEEAIPDILFLDVNMPCKDGVSCILEIRSNTKYNTMPVVMLTSLKSDKYVDACYSNGANYYLVKPTSIPLLAKWLQVIFAHRWDIEMFYPSKQEFVLS